MRIRQLDLLRYGKFTDQPLAFPHAGRDFHLVVGNNEAGKSTTRSAILDLLYGIGLRSTLDFLHAKAEMRLGAQIEQGAESLHFIRTKARTRSLLSPAGNALADTALAQFVGGTDRSFFEQMFSLDHEGLVKGGNAILDASNDIGQILFQSAAGIASLGTVRDQLAAEADTLWAPRRANNRAYYIASDELERAEAALKTVTVRTREWMEARNKVVELENRRDLLRTRYLGFEAERIRLERIRRVASSVRQWRACQAELAPLAGSVLLPPDAARQLAQTEGELAGAGRDRQLFTEQAAQLRERLQGIRPAPQWLNHASDIVRLSEQRQKVSNHERDIERRQLEITVLWQQVEALVREIGWPAGDEPTLRSQLPALLVRSAVAGLVKRFDVLDQARQSANETLADKTSEYAALQAQLAALSVATVPPALRAALASARGLGDLKAALHRDEARLSMCQRDLDTAVAGLGPWTFDLATLRSLVLPGDADIRDRSQRLAETQTLGKALADKEAEIRAAVDIRQLEIRQYRDAHHPVSLTDLMTARAERDAVWDTIKRADKTLPETALAYEARLTTADSVADQRHDKAREVSELQARLDALELLQQQAADNTARQFANDAARQAQVAGADHLMTALGLTGLPLQDFTSWRLTRDVALRADESLADVRAAWLATQQTELAALMDLRTSLQAADIAFDPATSMGTLVLMASDAVDQATATRARREELTRQYEQAATLLSRQRDKADTAQAQFDALSVDWRRALLDIGLADTTPVASAESALAVMAQIDDKLRSIGEKRQDRIETMQSDLCDFGHDAAAVIAAVAPALQQQGAAEAVIELVAGLNRALDDKKESDRLQAELSRLDGQVIAAHERLVHAQGTLLPLLHLAQVDDVDGLRVRIATSDQRRAIESAAAAARQAVEEGSDGLSLEALENEIASLDAAQVPVSMADTVRQTDAVRLEQETLMAELIQANTVFEKIAGQDDAARAESDRQNALAKMADAAERYIKVYTASRLLKWAIDRYRETRQGPMLGRAGAIFAALTLGSFQKLSVDFDSDPVSLQGLRADGRLVPIGGMSDGTRDQLYLALRLAALELHLTQGHAMPFIADDLFINYDDRRAKAGLEALATLSEHTQVIFLSHHDHLVPTVQAVFGREVNVVVL